jgi:hypothetical protein
MTREETERQLELDLLICGNSFYIVENGEKVRIDPTKIVMQTLNTKKSTDVDPKLKDMVTLEELLKMPMHSYTNITADNCGVTISILRVAGGWIYDDSVFVPEPKNERFLYLQNGKTGEIVVVPENMNESKIKQG